MSKPVVAIVGRPNAGKSTLLNRVVGKLQAITEDLPGTTRDRNMADVTWGGVDFTLVDTGGLEIKPGSAVARGIKTQIETAIEEADVIIDLVDVTDGVTPADYEVADMLRKTDKPVILAASRQRPTGNRSAGVLRTGTGRTRRHQRPPRPGSCRPAGQDCAPAASPGTCRTGYRSHQGGDCRQA